mmetsp:Transcript_16106/g.17381  ORF Transcript_16106/g.17381 Transcript_16106/m.17381 type:complete len:81 (-) Transcript_16106:342-584(-)
MLVRHDLRSHPMDAHTRPGLCDGLVVHRGLAVVHGLSGRGGAAGTRVAAAAAGPPAPGLVERRERAADAQGTQRHRQVPR